MSWLTLVLVVAFGATTLACGSICHDEDSCSTSAEEAGACGCLCCNPTTPQPLQTVSLKEAPDRMDPADPQSISMLLPADIFRPPTC